MILIFSVYLSIWASWKNLNSATQFLDFLTVGVDQKKFFNIKWLKFDKECWHSIEYVSFPKLISRNKKVLFKIPGFNDTKYLILKLSTFPKFLLMTGRVVHVLYMTYHLWDHFFYVFLKSLLYC